MDHEEGLDDLREAGRDTEGLAHEFAIECHLSELDDKATEKALDIMARSFSGEDNGLSGRGPEFDSPSSRQPEEDS